MITHYSIHMDLVDGVWHLKCRSEVGTINTISKSKMVALKTCFDRSKIKYEFQNNSPTSTKENDPC